MYGDKREPEAGMIQRLKRQFQGMDLRDLKIL